VIGVILLLMTLLLSYNRLLASLGSVGLLGHYGGSNIASAVPIMGNKIRFLMLGGNAVNANALLALLCVALHDPAPRCNVFRRNPLLAHSQGRRPLLARQRTGHRARQGSPAVTAKEGAIIMADSKDFTAGRRVQREEVSAPNCFHHTPHFGSSKS